MTEYISFRVRLDAVLRTLDSDRVRRFLIAENQWDEEAPADGEFAMWMMVAGSPTLRDLHEQARQWLLTHGHEEEAQIMLNRAKKPAAEHPKRGGDPRKGGRGGNRPGPGGARKRP
ncbi:MAG: hypothetical protein M3Y81_25075 [Chloroflexota bacterium]|nr:hypothetical protein [Chloroflexota bacterium]